MRIGLSALSFTYRCGLIGQGTERAVSQPLDVNDIISLAVRNRLQSIEFPLSLLPDLAPGRLESIRNRLHAERLTPIIDSDVIDIAMLQQHIPAAAALGASLLRVTISPVLEGWRSRLIDDWDAYIDRIIAQLRELRPLAEQHNICLAIENHQDATSADLIRICEAVGGAHIGITFDASNALIVGEDPLTVVRQIAPYLRNVHISDYMVYPSDQGWRLVRCALGEGEQNIRQLLSAIEQINPQISCQIELVSHSARHVRLLADDWWKGYPPRDVRDLLPVLRQFARSARSTDGDWRTPWERGSGEAQISFYEDQQFAASINYLRAIGILARPNT